MSNEAEMFSEEAKVKMPLHIFLILALSSQPPHHFSKCVRYKFPMIGNSTIFGRSL